MPQPLIYHIDVNSAFLSWEAAELLRQDPDAPDIRSFPSVIGGSEKTRHGLFSPSRPPQPRSASVPASRSPRQGASALI